ncbi:MAG: flavodoxin family protein [Deltaproteobacteria bacterium]|nr:flavodoxin family protein [Deltaproteobacteria bacterium]
MRVIVINAAPRMETGNTQMILTPFLVGMRDQGTRVDLAVLGRKKIKPCIGCFTCYAQTPGVCIHQDDMSALNERIRASDALVLATPLYLDGMTNLAKAFVDRLVTFLDPHFVDCDGGLRHPLRWRFPKKLFLVSICGYPGLRNFDPILLHMERIAINLHTEFVGALLRPAVFSCLLTKKYPERVKGVMDAVRTAGEEFARKGKVSRGVFEAAAADICAVEELREIANAYWDRELDRHGDRPA